MFEVEAYYYQMHPQISTKVMFRWSVFRPACHTFVKFESTFISNGRQIKSSQARHASHSHSVFRTHRCWPCLEPSCRSFKGLYTTMQYYYIVCVNSITVAKTSSLIQVIHLTIRARKSREFASKPEQPGLISSIHFEVVYIYALIMFTQMR